MLNIHIGMSRYEQISNDAVLCFTIFFTFIGVIISAGGLANAQEQQQQILPEIVTDNLHLI